MNHRAGDLITAAITNQPVSALVVVRGRDPVYDEEEYYERRRNEYRDDEYDAPRADPRRQPPPAQAPVKSVALILVYYQFAMLSGVF